MDTNLMNLLCKLTIVGAFLYLLAHFVNHLIKTDAVIQILMVLA